MKHKTNNPDRIGFKDCLGTTSLSTISAMSGVLMSTLFMQYMTDYAGLGAMGATPVSYTHLTLPTTPYV